MWVPYTCYYHLYSRDDLYACAERTGVDWILTMGDSQEREFVAQLKFMNSSLQDTTDAFQADFVMDSSPNRLRITYQFFSAAFRWVDAVATQRSFAMDQRYFDHFNIRPSAVRAGVRLSLQTLVHVFVCVAVVA